MIVIDASLAVKLYLDEPGSEEAIVLMESSAGEISAPDLLVVEVASALVRRANIDKHVGDAMQRKLASFAELASGGAIRLTRASPLDIEASASLAIELGHPLKDCIYLALAMELGCELVTCDARFAAKAKGVWARVRVLGA